MRKKIEDYDNYFIYDNGDVLNTSTNKILQGSIGKNGYKYYRLIGLMLILGSLGAYIIILKSKKSNN